MTINPGTFWIEKGRHRVVRVDRCGYDEVMAVSVTNRTGEECKVHRRHVRKVETFLQLFEETTKTSDCTCDRCMYLSPMEIQRKGWSKEIGDCFDEYKLFACQMCRRVAPWCFGGSNEIDTGEELISTERLCDDCTIELCNQLNGELC